MSLAFLAKKTWHTSNLKNVEKVWIAEQKKKADDKRLEDLKKQIEEEKQMQELRELQADGSKSAIVQRVDWMYDGPMAGTETSAEEYLMGKSVEGKAVDEEIGQLQSGEAAGSLFLKKETKANEAFTRLHEDPMLAIKKRQLEARKHVLNNPRQMQKLEAQVAEEKHRRKAKKKEKKERKKEKKAEKKEMKKRKKEEKRSGERTRSVSRSPPRGRDPPRSRESDQNEYDRRSCHGGRDRDRDRDRGHDRSRDYSSSDRGREMKRNDGREKEHHRKPESQPEREGQQPAPNKAGYGLQKTKYAVEKKGNYLGPDPAMLKKRRDFIASTEAKEQEQKEAESRSRKRPLTREEKEAAILEMQRDAQVNEILRDQRLKRARNREQVEDDRVEKDNTGVNPTFLGKLSKQSFVQEGDGAMAKRLSETKHYQHRGNDEDFQWKKL